jgi:uncharacterized DUF497 family protein
MRDWHWGPQVKACTALCNSHLYVKQKDLKRTHQRATSSRIRSFLWRFKIIERFFAAALKHDVLPSESEEIFFNDPLLLNHDARHSQSEPRFLALGITHDRRLLTVVFTLRENNTLIRIISARDQHRKERLVYAKAN